jgi:hypothetical protein
MPLPRTFSLIGGLILDNDVKQQAKVPTEQLGSLQGEHCSACSIFNSSGRYQSGRTRPQSSQHLQNARIKLRMDINRPMIPEPPPLQPSMDLNPTQPWVPTQVGRPIVKNPTLSRYLAAMTAPFPRKSSPLGSSQHQLSPRPGFPRSKPNPNFYRKALILLAKTSGAQPSHKFMRVAGKRSKKRAHPLGRVKPSHDSRAAATTCHGPQPNAAMETTPSWQANRQKPITLEELGYDGPLSPQVFAARFQSASTLPASRISALETQARPLPQGANIVSKDFRGSALSPITNLCG